jgi:putative transposase
LSTFDYLAPYSYFVTFCTKARVRVFVTDAQYEETLWQFRRTAQQECFALIAYCFMPDHVHLLVQDTAATSDLKRFIKMAKQRSGASCALRVGCPLWQEGFHDRVLRSTESLESVARYILENPVRADMVNHAAQYEFSDSDRWTMSELLESFRYQPGPKGPGPRTV